jgi:hypothetical protein
VQKIVYFFNHVYLTKEWSRVILEKLIAAQLLKYSLSFMEPEYSQPYSEGSAAGP